MIQVNKNHITITGEVPTILTELTILIKNINENIEEIDKEDIKKAVKDGFKTNEEIIKETKRIIKNKKEDGTYSAEDAFMEHLVNNWR